MPSARQGSAEGPIFTARAPGEVLQHAEILVLQQMSDGMKRLADGLDEVRGHVSDVRERVIKIESSGFMGQIAALTSDLTVCKGRVDALESDRDRRSGMGQLIEFANRALPWIVTLGIGLLAFVIHK